MNNFTEVQSGVVKQEDRDKVQCSFCPNNQDDGGFFVQADRSDSVICGECLIKMYDHLVKTITDQRASERLDTLMQEAPCGQA